MVVARLLKIPGVWGGHGGQRQGLRLGCEDIQISEKIRQLVWWVDYLDPPSLSCMILLPFITRWMHRYGFRVLAVSNLSITSSWPIVPAMAVLGNIIGLVTPQFTLFVSNHECCGEEQSYLWLTCESAPSWHDRDKCHQISGVGPDAVQCGHWWILKQVFRAHARPQIHSLIFVKPVN